MTVHSLDNGTFCESTFVVGGKSEDGSPEVVWFKYYDDQIFFFGPDDVIRVSNSRGFEGQYCLL